VEPAAEFDSTRENLADLGKGSTSDDVTKLLLPSIEVAVVSQAPFPELLGRLLQSNNTNITAQRAEVWMT
jgi:hypothetical protein